MSVATMAPTIGHPTMDAQSVDEAMQKLPPDMRSLLNSLVATILPSAVQSVLPSAVESVLDKMKKEATLKKRAQRYMAKVDSVASKKADFLGDWTCDSVTRIAPGASVPSSRTATNDPNKLTAHFYRHSITLCNEARREMHEKGTRSLVVSGTLPDGTPKTWDTADPWQDMDLSLNTPLSPAGRELADSMVPADVDRYVLSTMPRTLETASRACKAVKTIFDGPDEMTGKFVLENGSSIPWSKHDFLCETAMFPQTKDEEDALFEDDQRLIALLTQLHSEGKSVAVFGHGNRLARWNLMLNGTKDDMHIFENTEGFTAQLSRGGTSQPTERAEVGVTEATSAAGTATSADTTVGDATSVRDTTTSTSSTLKYAPTLAHRRGPASSAVSVGA